MRGGRGSLTSLIRTGPVTCASRSYAPYHLAVTPIVPLSVTSIVPLTVTSMVLLAVKIIIPVAVTPIVSAAVTAIFPNQLRHCISRWIN